MFGEMFARGAVAAETGERAWLRAMLDAETALAHALVQTGIAGPGDAEALETARRDGRVDADAAAGAAADAANPVVPLVKELTRAVDGGAARHVHQGATSQDIMDTAAVLVARRAGDAVLAETDRAASALAGLAEEHRWTPMPGRTLLQQALPTTFGLVAAGWLQAVTGAAEALRAELGRTPAQLGGAAGTLASLDGRGPEVAAAFADRLGLVRPVLPWHTDRGPLTAVASAAARTSGACGKVAGDIVLLAQTEVGEVAEQGGPGVGGSSAMPHKRNPVAAVSARACAEQVPGLVATLLNAQIHQPHQRAAGAWQAEWQAFDRLLCATGSAAAWLADSLERLSVDPDRMRRNLDLTGGLPMAERVAADLAPEMGRLPAHELVEAACREAAESGEGLAAVLDRRLAGRRTPEHIRGLLDPAAYLGAAGTFIDAALDGYRTRPEAP
ncbi:class-II fumarase/aspartase family protein [Nocardiopsis baichengensis]|uniref:class-II fumarase/aspartase family protein n=1 Tax=Nocardiopsis baichengensis TaxID=280240 RepID=UPI0003475699|nr:adenylosuccinate lyase family protein [Nocardiopsis baichengensis]